MKSFYDLDLKGYKKIKKDFSETVIGFRLQLVYEIFIILPIIDIGSSVLEIIFTAISNSSSKLNINFFEDSVIGLMEIICAVIMYSVYQRNLKQFYDEKNKK